MSESLKQLAERACAEASGIEDAVEALERMVSRSKGEQKKVLMQEALSWACREAVYDARHRTRTRVKFSPGHCKRGPGTMEAMGNMIMESILDNWKLDNGRPLGDATGEELAELAEKERRIAKGHMNNSQFYDKLAQAAGPNRVRDVTNDDDTRKLWESIIGRAAKK